MSSDPLYSLYILTQLAIGIVIAGALVSMAISLRNNKKEK